MSIDDRTGRTRAGGSVTARRTGEDDVSRARSAVRSAGAIETRPSRVSPNSSPWRTFTRRWGWRAYALPILAVVTIAALVRPGGSGGTAPAAGVGGGTGGTRSTGGSAPPPPAAGSTVLKRDAATGVDNGTALAAASLPAGAPYDPTGDGTFRVLKGTSAVAGKSGKLWRYSIDVENGLTGVDLAQFQSLVTSTLADPRSWSGHGIRIQRVDSGPIDFHITLSASMTVRKYCGYEIHAESSCYAPAGQSPGMDLQQNRVFFNDARWVRGAAAYLGDLAQYRLYMINHEDGHALGHIHAHECLPGGVAPAMMQQSFGLRSTATGAFCTANPWPYPPGVSGAPGAEQPDTSLNNEYGRGD